VSHSVVSIAEEAAAAGSTEPAPAHAEPQKSDLPRPVIVKKSKFFARPLSVEEAVMQMNLLGNDFLVFSNALSHQVNVVYRRKDGTYGLIETGPQ
jgi:putative sigma-54 modulation protein